MPPNNPNNQTKLDDVSQATRSSSREKTSDVAGGDILKIIVDEVLQIDKLALSAVYRSCCDVHDEDSSLRRGKPASSGRLCAHQSIVRKRSIDWNGVFSLWSNLPEKDQERIAQTPDQDGFYLLHYFLLAGAPHDIVELVLKSTTASPNAILQAKCASGLDATPLHLACFARCTRPTVERLVQIEPQSIYIRDAWGRYPLHLATLSRAEDLVEVLLRADVAKITLAAKDSQGHTALTLAVGRSSKVVACLLKECQMSDASKETDFQLKNHFQEHLPLHRAVKSESPLAHFRTAGQVVRLLASAQSDLLTATDHRGQTALHVAIADGNASTDAFRALLSLDEQDSTLATRDVLGQTPMDILFQKMLHQPESALQTVQALVRADDSRCFWAAVNDDGDSLLDRYVNRLVTGATEDSLTTSTNLLYHILLGTPPGSGFYGVSVTKSQVFLGQSLYEKFLGDPEWHRTMNMVMSQRVFTFYFMLDLYVRILLVVMFSTGTHDRLPDNNVYDKWWAFLITYFCAAYLLLWQVKLILRYELYYPRDIWSLLDVTTLVLVVVSAGILQSGGSVSSSRSFHVLVGGMLWFVTLTVALRSTFLPFAIFVSGLTKILLYMIPFGTTTFLILGAFAEMFYKAMIQRPECMEDLIEADFCRFDNSFLAVYNMFLSGIDPSLLSSDTANHLFWLSVSFQVTFAIVMLNVLVAVIFDAWGNVSPQGRTVFGRHRHRFLMEVTEKGWFFLAKPVAGSLRFLNVLEDHVGGVMKRFNARPATAHDSESLNVKLMETFHYILEGAYLVVWFLLGLCTAGVLWVKPFREAIFSFHSAHNNLYAAAEEEEAMKVADEAAATDARQALQRMEKEIQSLRALLVETTQRARRPDESANATVD